MGSLIRLALVFFKIGLFSIGGGYAIIPLIQDQVVERYGWISGRTFTDIITISQMTPGPLAVNTSTFIGLQIAGIPGAVVATAGCVFSGICISVFLYRFFSRHRRSDYVSGILNGLKASSLGLILSASVTIVLLAFTGNAAGNEGASFDVTAVLIFLASFPVIKKLKLNPVLIIIIAGIAGGIVY